MLERLHSLIFTFLFLGIIVPFSTHAFVLDSVNLDNDGIPSIQYKTGFADSIPRGSGKITIYGCYRQSFPAPCNGSTLTAPNNYSYYPGEPSSVAELNAWLNTPHLLTALRSNSSSQRQICIGRTTNNEVRSEYCTWSSGTSPNGSCSIASNILLEHGALNTNEVNNHTANTTMTVECTGKAGGGYTLSLLGPNVNGVAELAPNLTSRLSIDGNAFPVNGAGIRIIPALSKTFALQSILNSTGGLQAGVYQWSGILILNLF